MKTAMMFVLCFLSISTVSFAKTIVCLGDSLTEGYGVKREEAWPYLLEQSLTKSDPKVKVINSGISGSTTASGPQRINWHIKNMKKEPIDLLILGLGANDALRGLDVKAAKANLIKVVDLAQKAGIKVLLLGMKAPPSLGAEYAKTFDLIYPEIAKEKKVPLVPFMLLGVAADPKLNLQDGIHPNAAGHKVVAKVVEGYL